MRHSGWTIGVLGVMTPIVTERMASRVASHYLWDPPIPCACELAHQLRQQVDVLIALTHIGKSEDLKLAAQCPELDLILGGHSHTVLETPVRIERTAVCQGGSHARFVGRYVWDSERGLVEAGLLPLA